jgi:quaternary ammonium compound-resistance protein SugE
MTTNSAWINLIIAGIFETVWAIGMKYTEGFSKLIPSIWTLAAMGISVYLLSVAVRTIPIGTAYAVWTGIGAVGTVILGIFLFNETASFIRILLILVIIFAIIGLKITSNL